MDHYVTSFRLVSYMTITMADSSGKLCFIVAVLVLGANAGHIPSCQQQLTTGLSSSLNLSLLNSTCVRESFPGLSSITSSLFTSDVACVDNVLQLKSIIDVVLRGLASSNPICGINLNSLNLLNADVKLNILGLANVVISVLDVHLFGLQNLAASVSLASLSPTTLRVDLNVPLNLKAKIQASVGLGLNLLSAPISINAPIDIKAKATISLLVSIGAKRVLNVQVLNSPVCSVDDYDFSSGGLLGILNLGVVTSLVSTVVTGLVNSVGTLLSNLLHQLLSTCIQIVINANIA